MPIPTEYPFTRYLEAKRSVDDRSLNQHVWESLRRHPLLATGSSPLSILEIGAGIGTMIERTHGWGLFGHNNRPIRYTAIDSEPDNIAAAAARVRDLPPTTQLELEAVDLFDLLQRPQSSPQYDLIIAHAFLDLIDIPATLPRIADLARPHGLFYFTINFDGVTTLEPTIDPAFDDLIESLYHGTMDQRIVDGAPSGDSRSGRHLFTNLRSAGLDILAAGPSDWVVHGPGGNYIGDEEFFMHFIVNTMAGALVGHPELDGARFTEWVARRHQQIEEGVLVYIAHQQDFLACRSPIKA